MKSFIYLDQYKMYSLSSQLMEGVTDYILKESKSTQTDTEQQKGHVASGRIMAEIIESASASYEKKFLHDYAYSLFENKLVAENKISDIKYDDDLQSVASGVGNCKIIRVKSRAKFVDSLEIVKSLRSMQEVTQSLGIITSNDFREEIADLINKLSGEVGAKKSELAQLRDRLKAASNPNNYGDQSGNSRFYQKHLADVVEYGFQGGLDFSMLLATMQVTADLNRDNLRESIDSIVKKYSRISEVEFVMLGVVTQCGQRDGDEDLTMIDDGNLKGAISNTISALSAFESTFSGRLQSEIIVDPIAIYVQL
ncbi:DUF6414 family protein [Pseudomonas quasicaspiana]|uniref:DUF6414 family protein n=1 Tax=Pseudomonas quasicaspiana TaxID=2829821 RepID=UPI001E499ED7|nr:hypothetical protein [Pseudomonas quasicaspiana]MCD5977242.1 hypothetical protein [Pseudomonas quasicaspiana]